MGQISPFMGNILPLKMQKSWKISKISLFSLFLPRSGDLISVSPEGGLVCANSVISAPLFRVTRIIRTSPRALIFGAFGLVVLARLIHCVVLRTQNHLKIKTLGSEIFWLTNIRQQQENADDSILIHSRRLTN